MEIIHSLNIFPISEVLVVQCEANGCRFFDVYKIASDFPFEISLFATIHDVSSAKNDLRLTSKFLNKLTRKNMRGLRLRCAFVVRCNGLKIHTAALNLFFN